VTNLAEDDQKFLQELAEALGAVINSELSRMRDGASAHMLIC